MTLCAALEVVIVQSEERKRQSEREKERDINFL